MIKVVYQPFKNLEDQETFEKSIQLEVERSLNPVYEEGTEEDIKDAERMEELNKIVQGRLEERLINLSNCCEISTELLDEINSSYNFNTVVNFEEDTNQWEVNVNEIGADGCGDTKEDAIDMLLDNVKDLEDDYFENLELYLKIDNMKKQYPYFFRIKHCSTREELLKVLNL